MSKKEWLVTNYNVNIFPLAVLGKILTFDLRKVYGFNISKLIGEFKNDINRWASTYKEHDQHVPQMIKKISANKQWTKNIINKIYHYSQELVNFCKILPQKDLSKLSNKKLLNLYNQYVKKYIQMYVYGWLPNNVEGLQNLFSIKLERILRSKKINLKKIGEYFSILTTPTKESIIQKEKRDFLKLIKKTKSNHPQKDKLITKHWQKYCWIPYDYNGPAWTKSYFVKKFQKLSKVNPDEKLGKLKTENLKLKTYQKKIEKESSFSEQEKYLFESARELMFIKDYRKNILYQSYYCFDFALKEIAKRLGLTISQVKSILPQEMTQALLKGNIDVNLLNQRLKYSVIIYQDGQARALVGKQAKDYVNKHIKEKKIKGIKEIKGQSAYQGLAKGKIQIINDLRDVKKFKKGNILLSAKTTPNLLPAMIKACAIITDTGGVTSHAAIVARELKIPCIIGTKISTQVLKDGDLVEVDADKGIVKKI